MIVSLPMYWRAENAGLWRAFWSIAQDCARYEGVSLPDLTPPETLPADWYAHWLSPDLAMSMTCGLPFRSALKSKVHYIGTLDFGLDTPPGHYRSLIITRSDTQGPAITLAYNSADSQSGWAAAQGRQETASVTRYIPTGSHAASLAAVAEGRADIACLDAVTWRLLDRCDPNAARVRIVGQTDPTPGLPLIAAKGTDPAPLRAALTAATHAFAPEDAAAMGGPMSFCVLDEGLYHAQPIPAPPPV
ncbi:PhnD/SsuA/transferrin family substrate-binding protein [uncultured Marivita sp.]|uniref:phosphate/phosphite/phosphonate ABC transporter substrate-binding protein n=1 Tax=uncultured Marivita sp. TaxID=888080 RepID=UPI00262196B3|nr:PhnD/SsuA/transferrin family substrate-binding protein [uncultured Marivita sp.]